MHDSELKSTQQEEHLKSIPLLKSILYVEKSTWSHTVHTVWSERGTPSIIMGQWPVAVLIIQNIQKVPAASRKGW